MANDRTAWEHERRLAAFEQNSQNFRALNQLMWQIPLISMTLTGGLWFGASKTDLSPVSQFTLLGLAAAGNFGLSIALGRLRYILSEYLSWLKTFYAKGFVEAAGNGWWNRSQIVRYTFQAMLALAALVSGILMATTAAQAGWLNDLSRRPPSTFYDTFARDLADAYEGVSFESAHPALVSELHGTAPVAILDVGAGTGRDAAWLSNEGHLVTAVEPSDGLRRIAQQLHPGSDIRWVKDSLPDLASLTPYRARFRWIVLSAVWMHVRPSDRLRALQRLSELLDADGSIYLTIRSGPTEPARGIYDISLEDLRGLARAQGLRFRDLGERSDLLGRSGVTWHAVILSRAT